ncbi:MAG: aldo/keto reductase [Planctomycetaceae bacterium]|nr:MAG: aldo/keto reductase [Planctomycetaceae bacterium]
MNVGRQTDRSLSRLMIGTVQFGLPYGVANRTGQPTYAQVVEMVAVALESGVNGFDTAAAYGTSEQVLGRALSELRATDRVTVVTKVIPLEPAQRSDRSAAAQTIRDSVDRSREALRIDRLPLVLFHRAEDVVHADVLQELVDRGRVAAWGVSADHDPAVALRLLADSRISSLQLPGNLLDRRHQMADVFRQAESAGVTTFLRSVYLQGLLRMPASEVPANLREALPVRERLDAVARRYGLTLGELAVRYVLSQPGIGPLVVGVETVGQLRDNLEVFGRGPLAAEILEAVDAIEIDLPDRVLTPSRWNESPAASDSR